MARAGTFLLAGVTVTDVSAVVVTSTLAGFAAESPRTGKPTGATWRRLSAVLTMGVGAVVGALLLKWTSRCPWH